MAAPSAAADADMHKWLRAQTEIAQSRVVRYKRPLSRSLMLYFATRRTTTSDVVSIITTAAPFVESAADDAVVEQAKSGWNKELRRISVPRARPAPLKEAVYTSPLRNQATVKGEEHARRNKALWREQQLFSTNLRAKRDARFGLELEACTKIQCCARGWLMRRWLKRNVKKLRARRRMKRSYKVIQRQVKMKLQMEENQRMAEERRYNASIVINSCIRMFLAMRCARKEALMRHEELLNASATGIQQLVRKRFARRVVKKAWVRDHEERRLLAASAVQRVYRGRLGRRRTFVQRCSLQQVAAGVCQRVWRRYVARKVLRKERNKRREQEDNLGAIDIQRIFRGKLGRRVVFKIRHAEEELLRDAAALAVQRVYRGHLGRVVSGWERKRYKFEREIAVSIVVQRHYRAYLGRVAALDRKDESRADIFTQCRLGDKKAVEDLFAGFGTDVIYSLDSVDHQGNTVLCVAARWGHKKIARKCLRWGMKINHMNDRGETPVMLAVTHSHVELAEYLLTKEAEIGFYGRTLLHEAAKRGLPTIIQSLLSRGIRPNEKDPANDAMALHEAAMNDYEDCVRILIDRGADLNAVTADTLSTPLHFAAAEGFTEVVVALMEAGADVSLKDSKRRTPWRCALANNHEDCAHVLRKSWSAMVGQSEQEAASALLDDHDKLAIFDMARAGDASFQACEAQLDGGMPVDTQADNGESMLMAAAEGGAVRLIELCLRKGANVMLADKEGRTALHYAGAFPVAGEALIKGNGDIFAKDRRGRTPLHEACRYGHCYPARLKGAFSDATSGVNSASIMGITPLHCATRGVKQPKERWDGPGGLDGHPNCVELLIQNGAETSPVDNDGNTPAHFAALQTSQNGYKCVLSLMEGGADPSYQNKQGRSPVHNAAEHGCAESLAMLLEKFGLAQSADLNGLTPLHLAARNGHDKCLNLLFNYGGKANVRDQGRNATPLFEALDHGHDRCVALILGREEADHMEVYDEPLGFTPLHVAARAGNVRGCQQLVRNAGAMSSWLFDKMDGRGARPLQTAVEHGRADVAKYLVEAGHDPMLEEYIGEHGADANKMRTMLHAGARAATDAPKLIDYLVGLGFDLNEADSDGALCIHFAASGDNPLTLAALVNQGADVNVRDSLQRTPMHHAALAGSVNALQWLVENGADQAAEDAEGMTPVQTASAAEEDTCVEFLVTGVVPAAAGEQDDDGADDFDDAAFNALMGL